MSEKSCEIICVGTELLLGDIVNTNAQYIARGLAALGLNVFFQTVVGDSPQRLQQVLDIAKGRADIIITTGGLGPTYDDLTKETIAQNFGKKLVMHEKYLKLIEDYFKATKRVMTENNSKQALLPEGCLVLDNPNGTAPGCIIEAQDKVAIMMPGPPSEMHPMFDNLVKPYLRKYSHQVMVSHTIRVATIGESAMEDKLRDLMVANTNPTLAPYAKEGDCIVRFTAKANDEAAAEEMIAPLVEEVKKRLGHYAFGLDATSIEEYLLSIMAQRQLHLDIFDNFSAGQIYQRLATVANSQQVLGVGFSNNLTAQGMMNLMEKTVAPKPGYFRLAISAPTSKEIGDEQASQDQRSFVVTVEGEQKLWKNTFFCSSKRPQRAKIYATNRALNMLRIIIEDPESAREYCQ